MYVPLPEPGGWARICVECDVTKDHSWHALAHSCFVKSCSKILRFAPANHLGYVSKAVPSPYVMSPPVALILFVQKSCPRPQVLQDADSA